MSRDWIFLPVIIQVFLTLVVYLRLLQMKKRAAAAGQVDRKTVALRDDAWPDYVIQVNNTIRNQFELRVLFYVLAILLWLLESVDGIAVAAATVFVLSRIVHAGIHLSINAHTAAAAHVHHWLARQPSGRTTEYFRCPPVAAEARLSTRTVTAGCGFATGWRRMIKSARSDVVIVCRARIG